MQITSQHNNSIARNQMSVKASFISPASTFLIPAQLCQNHFLVNSNTVKIRVRVRDMVDVRVRIRIGYSYVSTI